jgi:hypothetical protein
MEENRIRKFKILLSLKLGIVTTIHFFEFESPLSIFRERWLLRLLVVAYRKNLISLNQHLCTM